MDRLFGKAQPGESDRARAINHRLHINLADAFQLELVGDAVIGIAGKGPGNAQEFLDDLGRRFPGHPPTALGFGLESFPAELLVGFLDLVEEGIIALF